MTKTNLYNQTKKYIERAKNFYPNLSLRQADGTSVEFHNTKNSIVTTKHFDIINTQFIHFTSIETLFNIINTKELRLFNLNNLNDPTELIYATKKANIAMNKADKELFKNCLFVMSCCGYNDTDTKDDFNMWRLYGQDGLGIGIVFEISNLRTDDWSNCFFGKVLYGDNDELDKLKNFATFHHEFNKDNNSNIEYSSIFPILSLFHKNEMWKIENEYRLFASSYHTKFTKQLTTKNHLALEVNHCINKIGNPTAFVSLPLNREEFTKQMEFKYPNSPLGKIAVKDTPHLIIKKVILGYNITESRSNSIKEILQKIFKEKLGYDDIVIEDSHLKQILKDF